MKNSCITYLRRPFCLAVALLFIHGYVKAGDTDTAKVMTMLRKSYALTMKPGENPEDLDEAIRLASKAGEVSRIRHFSKQEGLSYLYLALAFSEKKDDSQKEEHLKRAEETFRRIAYWAGLAEIAHMRAVSLPYDPAHIRQRIATEKQALEYRLRDGNALQVAQTYQELGDLYHILPDYDAALHMLNLSLANYQRAGYRQLQGIYDLLGTVYEVTGNYNEAIEYGLLAVKTGRSLKDSTRQMSTIYNRLGLSYYAMRDFPKAFTYQEQAIVLATKNKDLPSLFVIVCNTSLTLSRMQRYNEAIALLQRTARVLPKEDLVIKISFITRYLTIRLDQGHLEEARPYALQLLAALDRLPEDVPDFHQVLFSLNRYYFDDGKYEKALAILERYEHLPMVTPPERVSIYQNRFRADSALRNYRRAMEDHIAFSRLADSIFTEKKQRQLSQLNIQFETEAKDRELLLQNRQLQLQQSRLEHAQLSKRRFAITAVALVLIILLLISRYRLKQRTNRELTRQQGVISRRNDTLRHLLSEKEWLIKEIHHRVKNNLQIIMSLLNTQVRFLGEGAALDALQNSQSRVNSMALIHQKLYRSATMSSINMKDYIVDLVAYFSSAYVLQRQVRFRLELSPLIVDVSLAVPLSLILNEAITNALKYAFPDHQGNITILLSDLGDDSAVLAISDDGIGLPLGFEVTRQTSLGMNLIMGLSEDIGASCTISGKPGTTIRIDFDNSQPAVIPHHPGRTEFLN